MKTPLFWEWQRFIWLGQLTIRGSKPKSKELRGDRVEKVNGDWSALELCPVRNWPPNDVAWIECILKFTIVEYMFGCCMHSNFFIYLPAVFTAKVWPRLNAFSRRSSIERPWYKRKSDEKNDSAGKKLSEKLRWYTPTEENQEKKERKRMKRRKKGKRKKYIQKTRKRREKRKRSNKSNRWNRRNWRCPQDVCKMFPKCPQDVPKISPRCSQIVPNIFAPI